MLCGVQKWLLYANVMTAELPAKLQDDITKKSKLNVMFCLDKYVLKLNVICWSYAVILYIVHNKSLHIACVRKLS